MRYLTLILIFQLACSPTSELSEGEFNIQSANSFEFNGLRTFVELDREKFPSGKPMTGQLYLLEEQMFRDVAEELKLNYTKTFYYYPNGNLNNRVRLGELKDTLNFEIYSNEPLKSDTTTLEAFGITTNFSNRTNSYDTTFISTVEIIWN